MSLWKNIKDFCPPNVSHKTPLLACTTPPSFPFSDPTVSSIKFMKP